MQRRDFLKISAITGATAALDACGNPEHQMIRFIPEEDLVPGIATWKPSICTLCPAGCGLLVRVMQGEAEVVRNGQTGILKMGLAKKLEGNPAHPVNQGKLCPRGQSGLQVTYHPDRLRNPLARSGARGSAQFKEISWDDAIQQLITQLNAIVSAKQEQKVAWLSSPLRGQRKEIVSRFSAGLKGVAPVEYGFLEPEVARQANAASFGQASVSTADLAQTDYVISFGADFLGTWNSPVAQSVGYGTMRQGRMGRRAKFVQVEARMSQTGGNADEWIPCIPGTDGIFALSLAHVILAEKLRPAAAGAGAHIDGWAQGLPDYAPEKIEKQIGVPGATISRLAREIAAQDRALALIGDGPTAHTNGLFNALAVNALNSLLGNVGKPGGIAFTPAALAQNGKSSLPTSLRELAQKINSAADAVKVLLLYNANPVYGAAPGWGIKEALANVPFIVSFGNFLDETSILADLILPDHSPLESWLDDAPESGSTQKIVSVAAPAMHPLHNTRSMPDVLLQVAEKLGGDTAKSLPWKTYDEAIKASLSGLEKQKGSVTSTSADDFWKKVQDQGGWWTTDEKPAFPASGKGSGAPAKITPPQFEGAASDYPFYFLPFASQMLYEGSLAHLPWLQEAPDPMSSVMWGSWIEINTQTAAKLGIQQGDLIQVTSAHGTLQAPAMVVPGIAPDAIAMPLGQGHECFTRYANNRGANPISILAPRTVDGTDSLAWSATRVKIARTGEAGKLSLFGGSLRENNPELEQR